MVSAGAAALGASGQRDDTTSNRPDGVPLRIERYPTVEAEALGIVAFVRTALHQHSPSGIAVLARTNDQLVPIEQALSAAGIATQRAVGRSPLELALADAYRTTSREALALWADEQFTHHDPIRRRVAEEVDRFLTSQEPGGFRSWVESRAPFDDLDTEAVDGAVSLLTFHGAKGREWPVVIVAGAEDGLIPHSSALSEAQRAEEARLFYVAITRAVDHLIITRAESRRGSPTRPSPWLQAVEATIADDTSGTAAISSGRQSPDRSAGRLEGMAQPGRPRRRHRRAIDLQRHRAAQPAGSTRRPRLMNSPSALVSHPSRPPGCGRCPAVVSRVRR